MGLVQKSWNNLLQKIFWSNFMFDIRESHKDMCYNEGVDSRRSKEKQIYELGKTDSYIDLINSTNITKSITDQIKKTKVKL